MTKNKGKLAFTDAGITYTTGLRGRIGDWAWADVRVSLLDPGKKKTDLERVALIGLLGLAGRKRYTEIVVSTAKGDVDFHVLQDPNRRPLLLARLAEVAPESAGRVEAA